MKYDIETEEKILKDLNSDLYKARDEMEHFGYIGRREKIQKKMIKGLYIIYFIGAIVVIGPKIGKYELLFYLLGYLGISFIVAIIAGLIIGALPDYIVKNEENELKNRLKILNKKTDEQKEKVDKLRIEQKKDEENKLINSINEDAIKLKNNQDKVLPIINAIYSYFDELYKKRVSSTSYDIHFQHIQLYFECTVLKGSIIFKEDEYRDRPGGLERTFSFSAKGYKQLNTDSECSVLAKFLENALYDYIEKKYNPFKIDSKYFRYCIHEWDDSDYDHHVYKVDAHSRFEILFNNPSYIDPQKGTSIF